jgi:hypothetical protein
MSTKEFILEDQPKTLFPTKTNELVIRHGDKLIQEHIAKCFSQTESSYSFLPQQRVHASKYGLNLRRTVKLDPVAEYYLYDTIYKHRTKFRKPRNRARVHFGYRFQGGKPINPTQSYKGFKSAIAKYTSKYRYFITFDIASYFNCIYHHDLAAWFHELGVEQGEYQEFGQYFREINAGRSVDILPHGLYPSKMIGNDFLRFIDEHHGLASNQTLRFMDDFYLFSDRAEDIRSDFLLVQKVLGERCLNLNPGKTSGVEPTHTKIDAGIDAIKKKLLDRRREIVNVGYDDDDEEIEEILVKKPLSKAEIEYIISLLAQETLDEEDAELILTVMRSHATKVERKLDYIIQSFPNLMKPIFKFCASVKDKEFIGDLIAKHVQSSELQEYQLFWFASILDEYLLNTKKASSLIRALYSHKNATPISKAKVLEIADKRFGLPELREPILRSGQSDWLSWSAAIGERSLKAASRNHRLRYFSKGSPMNFLISQVVAKL